MTGKVITETSRTIIREITAEKSDIDGLFAVYSGEHSTDFMEPLFPYEEETEYQKDYIRNIYGYYGYGMWLVVEKATGGIIGRAGIECREGCLPHEVELGYIIREDRQRQGFAAEVCRAIIDYAFGPLEMELESICSRTHPGNKASIALLEKLGFSDTGAMSPDGEEIYRLYKA